MLQAPQCQFIPQITFASYRVPIYTPGWRAAMWIKCLAEGQKVPGIDGNRTWNPLIQSQGFTPMYHGTSTRMVRITLHRGALNTSTCYAPDAIGCWKALYFRVVHPSVRESRYRDIWRTPGWIFLLLGPKMCVCVCVCACMCVFVRVFARESSAPDGNHFPHSSASEWIYATGCRTIGL